MVWANVVPRGEGGARGRGDSPLNSGQGDGTISLLMQKRFRECWRGFTKVLRPVKPQEKVSIQGEGTGLFFSIVSYRERVKRVEGEGS